MANTTIPQWNWDTNQQWAQGVNNATNQTFGTNIGGNNPLITDINTDPSFGLDFDWSNLGNIGKLVSGLSSLGGVILGYHDRKAADEERDAANRRWQDNYAASRAALNRHYDINDEYNRRAGGYVSGKRIPKSTA
jgi:hypothetical protein